ncbi:MAG: phosphoribosylformylglycinamidine synthase [Desulfobacterales bacterium]|nr:phosphoribosylformylglycinamidine synthase [Desulfobacterales bacterium]
MTHRIEITLKNNLFDAEGQGICKKAKNYFGITLDKVRVISVVTIDKNLSIEQLKTIQNHVFTNPVTQISSFEPIDIPFDWIIWIGYRPGVRDNPGSTAMEAISDILGVKFAKDESVYTSKRYCIEGKSLRFSDLSKIATELLANDIINQWKIYSKNDWNKNIGIGYIIPKVRLNHTPTVTLIPIEEESSLEKISKDRNLYLNPNDIPTIKNYFLRKEVMEGRNSVGLSDPTDIELEYISQARSDHCNHNTFRALFRYRESKDSEIEIVDNLFRTYIESPTLEIKAKKSWVVSVLWDNGGVGKFDDNNYYVITGETHNSPSNIEAYGGSITGIVGVYRDPMGTGKGSKLVMGGYGFCVGNRDYKGELKPKLHPRRLLDGLIEGVRDGGNKSGIPTCFGQVIFHPGYMGKCLVFVTAVGIMPSKVAGEPSELKKTSPEEVVVMCGGRIGKDGIHGATASSDIFSENTPAGHVQIGDPYTQKKMHDFILEARDKGLIEFITDNGAGGLSSSVGETARFSNGCEIWLEKVPLKYEGLDQWEIWVSESQERMTISVKKENIETFLKLSQKHEVESTIIGKYVNSGKLHITYNGKTCAYVDMDFLKSGFPQWEFDAVWQTPEERGLYEPVISAPKNYERLLLDILSSPNICSKEWITRQYDHEVQGGSVIKPMSGVYRDVYSDAAVIRPVLESNKGLVFAQSLIPIYSLIDAYHMTAATIDEAVRRIISVGGSFEHIAGVDNFCWPSISFDPKENPDGRFKAAQLVRSCRALADICLSYEIPLLSGKDSMYVDGHIAGKYGETHKISALPTIQFSAIGVTGNIEKCQSMESKFPEDLIYILGVTRNELGASEYYMNLGYTGINVPKVFPDSFKKLYTALETAIKNEWVASSHGIYRGGILVHLAFVSMAGNLGIDVDLNLVPCDSDYRDDTILFSESCGRFIITIAPEFKDKFEKLFNGLPCSCIGSVTKNPDFIVSGKDGKTIISLPVSELRSAWKKPFGDLI